MFTESDERWMRRALELAHMSAELGEIPVGAVIVRDGVLLGEGHNQLIMSHDPTGHAELVALRAACSSVANYRLPGVTLYVTLEPCAMCAGALVHARVGKVVFATREPKAGAVISTQCFFEAPQLNHRIEYREGLLQTEASDMLSRFFKRRRQENKAKKR